MKLIETAENYAKEKKCCHIEMTSGSHRAKIGSHDFYKKLGYIELNKIKKYFAKKLNE